MNESLSEVTEIHRRGRGFTSRSEGVHSLNPNIDMNVKKTTNSNTITNLSTTIESNETITNTKHTKDIIINASNTKINTESPPKRRTSIDFDEERLAASKRISVSVSSNRQSSRSRSRDRLRPIDSRYSSVDSKRNSSLIRDEVKREHSSSRGRSTSIRRDTPIDDNPSRSISRTAVTTDLLESIRAKVSVENNANVSDVTNSTKIIGQNPPNANTRLSDDQLMMLMGAPVNLGATPSLGLCGSSKAAATSGPNGTTGHAPDGFDTSMHAGGSKPTEAAAIAAANSVLNTAASAGRTGMPLLGMQSAITTLQMPHGVGGNVTIGAVPSAACALLGQAGVMGLLASITPTRILAILNALTDDDYANDESMFCIGFFSSSSSFFLFFNFFIAYIEY
jgi:hypothetical protein